MLQNGVAWTTISWILGTATLGTLCMDSTGRASSYSSHCPSSSSCSPNCSSRCASYCSSPSTCSSSRSTLANRNWPSCARRAARGRRLPGPPAPARRKRPTPRFESPRAARPRAAYRRPTKSRLGSLFQPSHRSTPAGSTCRARRPAEAQTGPADKVALMLNLCGADWKPRFVDYFNGETRTPAFRAINVMGEVPVLEHAGKRLTQSGVILDYLAERLGKFGAVDADERREILRWLLF